MKTHSVLCYMRIDGRTDRIKWAIHKEKCAYKPCALPTVNICVFLMCYVTGCNLIFHDHSLQGERVSGISDNTTLTLRTNSPQVSKPHSKDLSNFNVCLTREVLANSVIGFVV
jgi:hypothetical protein